VGKPSEPIGDQMQIVTAWATNYDDSTVVRKLGDGFLDSLFALLAGEFQV
jgi:hypothetical protein